ncbi:MAG: exosortase system-associated protein, TIGR04073 family [Methylohalobius sp.]
MSKARLWIAACLALIALTTSETQAQTAAHKLGRGLAAITLSFLDIPGLALRGAKCRGAIGFFIGLAGGLEMSATRALYGVLELVTAPFPFPPGYQSFISLYPPDSSLPEYPWEHFFMMDICPIPEYPWEIRRKKPSSEPSR